MFQLTHDNGEPLFECSQISLVCEACLKSDHPERYAVQRRIVCVVEVCLRLKVFSIVQMYSQAGRPAAMA